jgi:hypothetical protein
LVLEYSKDFKAFHIIEEEKNKILNIFTHYPIGTANSEKYKNPSFFKTLEKYLLLLIENKYNNYKIVNYH